MPRNEDDRIHILSFSVPNTLAGNALMQTLSPQRLESTYHTPKPIPFSVPEALSHHGSIPHDEDDVFTAMPHTTRLASTKVHAGTPATPSVAGTCTPAPTPGQRAVPPHYNNSVTDSNNQFVHPPANARDWIPAHRRHHYGGRLEDRHHFAVPQETLTVIPPNLGSKGWRNKRWYVVARGYDIGIFFDFWYAHFIFTSCR
jgi:hypothetical protein